jgi:hypothetical protein
VGRCAGGDERRCDEYPFHGVSVSVVGRSWPPRLGAWSASLRNHADSRQNWAGLAISRQISAFSGQPRFALAGILVQHRADGVLGGADRDADHGRFWREPMDTTLAAACPVT